MKKNMSWRILRIAAATLFMFAVGMAFAGFGAKTAGLLHLQFGPALMRCLAAFSAGTLAAVLSVMLATFLFGRFYCAVFCPFGILQDIAGRLSYRKGKTMPNFIRTRYLIAGIAFGMLAAGWTMPFLLLDPYSNFGRIAGSFTAGGIIPLAVIVILSVWKKRIYCTAICPVGTLLGLFSRHAMFRLRLSDTCVKCGMCVRSCPSGCIDPQAGILDNERCVRCMNCVSICRFRGIAFGLATGKETVPTDISRRAFLVNSGILIAGLAAGTVLARTGMKKLTDFAEKCRILPPGAGDARRFAEKCTACQLCTKNCPAKIIVPAPGGDGPVSLDLTKGACLYDCNRCSQLCPTGAIRPLTLEKKQKIRIAEAKFNPRTCIVFQNGEQCGKCAGVCPTGAIRLRKSGAPYPVKAALCIGCGACRQICPAPEKAMTMHEIEKQTILEAS